MARRLQISDVSQLGNRLQLLAQHHLGGSQVMVQLQVKPVLRRLTQGPPDQRTSTRAGPPGFEAVQPAASTRRNLSGAMIGQ